MFAFDMECREGGARPGDDGSRWRRAGGRLGSGRSCAKEAAVPEGHGEAWRQRSCGKLNDGHDVGSQWKKSGNECCEGGCGDGGSQQNLVLHGGAKKHGRA